MRGKSRDGADQMDQIHNRNKKIENSLLDSSVRCDLISPLLKKHRADSKSSKSISVKDFSFDSRLLVSDIDKEVPKVLELNICPVVDLLNCLEEKSSSSCISSVGQGNSFVENLGDTGKTDDSYGSSKISVCTCKEVVEKMSLPTVPKENGRATLCVDDDVGCVSHSTDDDLFCSQAAFNVGEICTVWAFEERNRECSECVEDGVIDSEGASLFLAIQQSRAFDFINYSCSQTQPVVDEDVNDFDPYSFIQQLPDLSEVVSPCPSPALLPKETQWCYCNTLVLDLDETLVHSSLGYCENANFNFPARFNDQDYTVSVRCRPHLQVFLERMSQIFEIVVFTASQSAYADPLLNMLDVKRKLFRRRMFRDSCILVDGNYVKDLSVLGIDLGKVVIVDNTPQAFNFQVDNGIHIESWFDDESDSALLALLPFLEILANVDDVRPLISRRFRLGQKMTATVDLWSIRNAGDPLDRCC